MYEVGNVNELDTSLLLYLLTDGAVFQGRENELVVAPDKLVCPSGFLPSPEIEKAKLGGGILRLFSPWFVNLLDDLKGQDNGAHLTGFAVPDELNFAFVVEKEKAVFIGERFFSLKVADDFPLFVVGEFHSLSNWDIFTCSINHQNGTSAFGREAISWSKIICDAATAIAYSAIAGVAFPPSAPP